jgi:hypothetical protein
MTAHDISICGPCAVIDRAYKEMKSKFFSWVQARSYRAHIFSPEKS